MFRILRSQTKAIVTILISLIIPAFVLWGVSSAVIARKANLAGSVWGERVDMATYNQSLAACQLNAMLTYGDHYEKIAPYLNLQEAAWERIALVESAKAEDISISDKELIQHIQSYGFFKHNGVFSKERYYLILRQALKITPEKFEKRERDSLLVQKRISQIKKNVFLSDEELFDAYRILKEKVNVAYVAFPLDKFKADVEDSSPEIKDYFNAHAKNFTQPAQRVIAYAHIKPLDMPNANISEEQAKNYYENNKELYQNEDATYQSFDAVRSSILSILQTNHKETLARKKANEITEDLLDELKLKDIEQARGISFTESAPFAQGQVIPGISSGQTLSQAAFRLDVGASSDIISTTEGLFVIKVLEEKEPYIPEIDAIFPAVKEAFLNKQSKDLAQVAARNMRATILKAMTESTNSFSKSATALNLELIQPEPFTQNAPVSTGVGYSPEFNKESFALSIGEISEPVLTEKGFIILSPLERIRVSKESFLADETKDAFSKRVLSQKETLIYNTWIKQLKEQAQISPNPKYFS